MSLNPGSGEDLGLEELIVIAKDVILQDLNFQLQVVNFLHREDVPAALLAAGLVLLLTLNDRRFLLG